MKNKKKIFLVVGARPNFMKAAPLYNELQRSSALQPILVHTGQHYDYEMSQVFFEDLALAEPEFFLNVGSGSHAEQTAKIMLEFEKVLEKEKCDLVIVFGDVNSTIACSLTAKKMGVPVGHVEAGLRSFDESMPEEINRRLTDAVSDFLFTPSLDGNENLKREGVTEEKVFFVGNIMIDSLKKIIDGLSGDSEKKVLNQFGVDFKNYGLITLHRPSNVDNRDQLLHICRVLKKISDKIQLVFPVHPRTQKNIQELEINFESGDNLVLVKPLRFKEFITLEKNARFVLTDSGGIQEETTYLNIPCFTLRPNTERPITISEGTNSLVNANSMEKKISLLNSEFNSTALQKKENSIMFWDGKSAERIGKVLKTKLI